MDFPIEKIEKIIYTIRGQRVMLDSDLAKLYGVETKALNRQLKRNLSRFPSDFMFQITSDENEILRCQNGTSKQKGGRRYQPFVFTELGVAMLSSVLNSDRAAEVNITIMRTFVKLRSFLTMGNPLDERVRNLEADVQEAQTLFRAVFEKLDRIEIQITPKLSPHRKKIGLK